MFCFFTLSTLQSLLSTKRKPASLTGLKISIHSLLFDSTNLPSMNSLVVGCARQSISQWLDYPKAAAATIIPYMCIVFCCPENSSHSENLQSQFDHQLPKEKDTEKGTNRKVTCGGLDIPFTIQPHMLWLLFPPHFITCPPSSAFPHSCQPVRRTGCLPRGVHTPVYLSCLPSYCPLA